MSSKDIENYKSIEAHRGSNPEMGLRDIFSARKISPASYYRGRKLSLSSPAKRKNAIAAAAKSTKTKEKKVLPLSKGHMILLIGTPEQMRSALSDSL